MDAIDRNIIRLLRINAHMSNTKLAAEVGLSPSACLRRMHLLEEAGTIQGYTAVIGGAQARAASPSSSTSPWSGRTKSTSTASRQPSASIPKFASAI